MAFLKLGEAIDVTNADILTAEAVFADPDISERFTKIAADLKKIAPKAEDFLYFSAIMMHASEASSLNDDGSIKLTASGEPVKVGWETNGDSWKWKTNDPKILPYKNCFPAKTQILMHDGSSKNIEDIVAGDLVFTHTNSVKKVVRTFITPHDGELLEIKASHGPSIQTTSEHPFYRLNVDKLEGSARKQLTRDIKKGESEFDYSFIPAKNLEIGDMLLAPQISQDYKSVYSEELNGNRARLLGLFAAEGCYNRKYNKLQGVIFTFNIKETYFADLIVKICEEEFPECSVRVNPSPTRSILNVSITGHNIAQFFNYHCGEYSDKKILSKELVFGSDDVKRNFLMGWLEGDGCLIEGNKIIGVTTSPYMSWQTNLMFHSLGISSSLRYKKSDGVFKQVNKNYPACKISDSYRIEAYGTCYKKLNLSSPKYDSLYKEKDNKALKNMTSFIDGNFIRTIKQINRIQFKGDVYNFEVEGDNSYIANGFKVHNCNQDTFPAPELLKAYKQWVGKPLCIDHKSSSVDHVRGVIIDTYYDHKNMRVIALCALDRKSYPELAHKVATGVSASVSMGTAVGKAICFDCGKVARTADEFCKHMQNKTSYAEINVDLQPIELSIVVNGADKKAKIKQIIAAANNLNNYLDMKKQELKKVASEEAMKELADLKKQLNDAKEKAEEIEKILQNDEEIVKDLEKNEENSAIDQNVEENSSNNNANIESKASTEISDMLNKLSSNLQYLTTKIDSLDLKGATVSDITKKSYFQGGGGVNEPQKYPADPMNEKIREEARELQVDDMGPVDGLYPGDMEKKKILLRAQEEERKIRRAAALEKAKNNLQTTKEAYFQGGGKENEPQKYPIDKGNEAREEDKHLVGKKPFPGVGDVEGLLGGKEELAQKKLLQRANLKLRFVKAANLDGTHNPGNSAWEVLADDKRVSSFTVKELSAGRVEALYNVIASRNFGIDMLNKIKTHGFEKAATMLKRADDGGLTPSGAVAPATEAPAPAPAAPAEPPADLGMELPPAPATEMETPESTESIKNPSEKAQEAVKELENVSSDVAEAVEALVGEQPEVAGEAPKTASVETRQLFRMRRELNSSLITSMKKCRASLDQHKKELELIASMSGNISSSNKKEMDILIADAFKDAKEAVAGAHQLLGAFVKYARGTEHLVKRAQNEMRIKTAERHDGMEHLLEDSSMDEHEPTLEELLNEDVGVHSVEDEDHEDYEDHDESAESELHDENLSDDVYTKHPEKVSEIMSHNPEATVHVASTKEGRAALRAKLAADIALDMDMINDAHSEKNPRLDTETKAQDELDVIEGVEATHEKMLDIVNAPVSVRKEAEEIQKLVLAGEISAKDVDSLVRHGADAQAVSYWKKFFGESGKEGSEFAKELVKENEKTKLAEDLKSYKIKMARAYNLAYEMALKDVISKEASALEAKVEEIMEWNDASFNSVKKSLASMHALSKSASTLPTVGLIGNSVASSYEKPADDIYTMFSSHFSKGRH